MLKVYTASRINHFGKWLKLRDEFPAINFNARWIDHKHLQAEIMAQAAQSSSTLPNDIATQVWIDDIEDVMAADYCIVYAEKGDHLRGALVEAGAAIAAGKKVIVIGEHKDYGTWQFHPSVIRVASIEDASQYIFKAEYLTMTLKSRIAEIESQTPKYQWLLRTVDGKYLANVFEDVDLTRIPNADIDRYRSIGTGPTPEIALAEAFRLAEGKRLANAQHK